MQGKAEAPKGCTVHATENRVLITSVDVGSKPYHFRSLYLHREGATTQVANIMFAPLDVSTLPFKTVPDEFE